MKCQLHISKTLSSNHTRFMKIASNYFSISAVKDSGVNAVVPLVRQIFFSCLFHMLESSYNILLMYNYFLLYIALLRKRASFSLGLEGYLWETKWIRKLYPGWRGSAFGSAPRALGSLGSAGA